MTQVNYRAEDNIGWVEFSAADPNLGLAETRRALRDSLEAAQLDDATDVIAIGCVGGGITGSMVPTLTATSHNDAEDDAVSMADLCGMLEDSPKPVIILVSGKIDLTVLSLMLAAHYRLVDMSFSCALSGWVGLPSGHTQRLPHLVGAQHALNILRGDRLPAVTAQKIGLVDGLARQDLQKAVRTFLGRRDGTPLPIRPTLGVRAGLTDAAQFHTEIDAARTQAEARLDQRLIDCVEGALLLPFDIGLNFEDAAFEELQKNPDVRMAQRLTELRARAWPGLKTGDSPKVCLLGATDTAVHWLETCVSRGIPARMYVPQTEMAARVARIWERRTRGWKTPIPADRVLTSDRSALSADWVINTQSYRETPAPKAMAALQRPDTHVGFTTPFQPLTENAKVFETPDGVVSLSLASGGTLMEWACLDPENMDVASKVQTLAAHMDVALIQVGPTGGFLTTRLEDGLLYAVELMLAAGLSPAAIDAGLAARGWKTAPLRAYDETGFRMLAERQNLFQTHLPKAALAPGLLGDLLKKGETGRAAGAGFYDHRQDGQATNPTLEKALRDLTEHAGTLPDVPDIANFAITTLAHIGCRAIGRGFVSSADAVDLAALGAGLVPASLGGPMVAAEDMGLTNVLPVQQAWGDANAFLRPTTVMVKASKVGRFPRGATAEPAGSP